MLSLLPKKWLLVAGLLAALGVLLWFWRSEIYKAAEQALALQINQRTLQIVEKRNDIANNRPDDDATIKRLLNGTF